MNRFFEQGTQAGRQPGNTQCPYPKGSAKWEAWRAGFEEVRYPTK